MGYDFSSTSLELKPKKINNIFEESSLQKIKEIHNTKCQQMLAKSKNVSKLTKIEKFFTSENLEEYSKKEENDEAEYSFQFQREQSSSSSQQFEGRVSSNSTQLEDKMSISFSYDTNIQDLKNTFYENLQQKFNPKYFEEVIYTLCIMRAHQLDKFNRTEKMNVLSEMFEIPKEDSQVIFQLVIGEQLEDNLQSSQAGGVISTRIKSFMSMISNISSFRISEQQTQCNTNTLSDLFLKMVQWPEAEPLPISSNLNFFKDYLQNLLIIVALNNQWHSSLEFSLSSEQFEKTASFFVDLAKIFLCNSIRGEDILLNLRELNSFEIFNICYPLTFQIAKILIKKLILEFNATSTLQMMKTNWNQGFNLAIDFSQNQLKLSKHTLNLILIYECYFSYIVKLKNYHKSNFISCFSEIQEIKFQYEDQSKIPTLEQEIQKQITKLVLDDLQDVISHLHLYLFLGVPCTSIFCQIYNYLLSFATDNNESSKRSILFQDITMFGRNMQFDILKQITQESNQSESKDGSFLSDIAMYCFEDSSNKDSEMINVNELQKERYSPTLSLSSPKKSKSVSQQESNIDEEEKIQTSEAQALNSLEVSIYCLESENSCNKQEGQDIKDVSLKNSQQIENTPQVQKNQENMNPKMQCEINLIKIEKMLKILIEDKDSYFILHTYLKELQVEFGFAQNELALLLIDNLISEVLQDIRLTIHDDIPSTSNQLLFSICQSLQKLDKLVGFQKSPSYLETALPFLKIWIESQKQEFAALSIECFKKEEWILKRLHGDIICYHSQNCEEFVQLLLKRMNDLHQISGVQSHLFSRIIVEQSESIALETCQSYCELMIHSLDALGKHLSEISFTPIDKCMDENSFESTSELEDNLSILRKICLRIGNITYLCESITSNISMKNLAVFELLIDTISAQKKKACEIIGKSFVNIFLKNLFDCYLQHIDSYCLTEDFEDETRNMLPKYKSYFSLLLRRIPKSVFFQVESIILSQIEKQLIISYTDINKLDKITNQNKFVDFIQDEIQFFIEFLRHCFSKGVQFSEVYKIPILFQKSTSDLIINLNSPLLSEFDKKLTFRILFIRKKTDQVARNYVKTIQHKYLQKRQFKLNRFLNS